MKNGNFRSRVWFEFCDKENLKDCLNFQRNLFLKVNYKNDKYSKINFEIFFILFFIIPYIFGINIRLEASPLPKSIRIIQLPDYCHQSMNSLCKSIRNHGWNVWIHLVELQGARVRMIHEGEFRSCKHLLVQILQNYRVITLFSAELLSSSISIPFDVRFIVKSLSHRYGSSH